MNIHLPKNAERDGGGIVREEGRRKEEWLEATCIVLIQDSSFDFIFFYTESKILFLTFI